MAGNSEEKESHAGCFSISLAAYVPRLSLELFCVGILNKTKTEYVSRPIFISFYNVTESQ
jgi:hypothetical protein